jgi:hypothetical protein
LAAFSDRALTFADKPCCSPRAAVDPLRPGFEIDGADDAEKTLDPFMEDALLIDCGAATSRNSELLFVGSTPFDLSSLSSTAFGRIDKPTFSFSSENVMRRAWSMSLMAWPTAFLSNLRASSSKL